MEVSSTQETLIRELGITMKLPALPDEEVQRASFFLIRHGYSQYNYMDKMLEKKHGEGSPEHKALKLDTSMMDPGLHDIGIKQCEDN